MSGHVRDHWPEDSDAFLALKSKTTPSCMALLVCEQGDKYESTAEQTRLWYAIRKPSVRRSLSAALKRLDSKDGEMVQMRKHFDHASLPLAEAHGVPFGKLLEYVQSKDMLSG